MDKRKPRFRVFAKGAMHIDVQDWGEGECWRRLGMLSFGEILDYFHVTEYTGQGNLWEGDIVLHERGDHKRVGVIKMGEFEWVVDYINSATSTLRSQHQVVKVIGNIHEHPHLVPRRV
jgi:hypothetical protein